MIQKLWLYPPLAFARLGPSKSPCDSFRWGPNDLHHRGTGKTTIQPAETLRLAPDGSVTSRTPTKITFRDAAGLRPVCPFFELHAEWTNSDGSKHSGPVTPKILATFGLSAGDIKWRIELANLKPFNFTLENDDRIAATVELTGDVTERQEVFGTSPPNARNPLIPMGQFIPLGSLQLTKPSNKFPEFRLRFTPANGRVYGPTNLDERSRTFVLSQEVLILNPEAAWCRFVPKGNDFRTNPSGLYATDDDGVSLGLVDDVCDGVISCSLENIRPAFARVVVGPPNYAPDRRPFTSLADGLTDRVRRHDVHDPAYVEDMEMTTFEVRDMMERIFETMGLMNVDAQNDRCRLENRAIAVAHGLPPDAAEDKAFPRMEPILDRPLSLTELGRQRHRRFVSLEVFEDILRERLELIDSIIREPMTGDRYYDQRMPALMRGSDRYPMHITRRQYDLLMAWAQRLRRDVEDVS